MTTFAYPKTPRPMVLRLFTAAELMTPNPLSFGKDMTIHKADALLQFHRLKAAPVVDDQRRLIGEVTVAACAAWEEFSLRSSPHGFVSEDLDWTTIEEITSPIVQRVRDDDSTRDVIDSLLRRKARRVYVVNDSDELVGVISMADVLRYLTDGSDLQRVSRAGAAHLC